MGSEPNRFIQPQPVPAPRLKRWGGCLGGLPCFRKQKGGKRIVPSRTPEGNAGSNQPNGLQVGGLPNQTIGIVPSLYAPPSSPASFSNSALQSTAPSPNCFLSANSPGGPSSTMYATGPYAHEQQLVSPPVFSTYTTEPSTAPVTPPPELAHLTTPSSPDVPYAHFLSSSGNIRGTGKMSCIATNDLHAAYSLYPGSPPSNLRSPMIHEDVNSKPRQGSNFFCPETFAQFYQDQSSFGGRLSISKESDAHGNSGNGQPNRQTRNTKPDAEELEAYRASFGFSADEVITTTNYVEISNVLEDSFSMAPLAPTKSVGQENAINAPPKAEVEARKKRGDIERRGPASYHSREDQVEVKQVGDVSGRSLPNIHILSDDDDDIFCNMGGPRICRNYEFGPSNSDAEIEYRRGQKLREERSWRGRQGK